MDPPREPLQGADPADTRFWASGLQTGRAYIPAVYVRVFLRLQEINPMHTVLTTSCPHRQPQVQAAAHRAGGAGLGRAPGEGPVLF